MNALVTFPVGREYDMTREDGGPDKITLEQFRHTLVSAERMRMRGIIYALESRMRSPEIEERGYVRMDDKHELMQPILHWIPGVLIRELRMFAGAFIVGKRHAQRHHCVVSCGIATVMTERGWQVIEGPCQFTSPAGTKRVLFIHEDMVWSTIHRTDATSLEEAEADVILNEDDLTMLEAA